MMDLFTNILKTSLSGGVIILLVLLMRLVFRSTPKALICLCWMVAILRLLLPFQIEAGWSLQPYSAALTDRTESFQVSLDDLTYEYVNFQPTEMELPTYTNSGLSSYQLLGLIWLVGFALMQGSALISYLRLRKRVGQCVKLSKGVYWCPGLDTAFLFGYFRPRIYLPEPEDKENRFIVLHEQAHLQRGDHWLMLLGYFALCIHWFNPLAWISYIYLCRDIESACDERVIGTLNTQERKEYAAALLACGKHRSFPVSCPVAFGEVSIKQRILRVLNYRRPALGVCVVLLVVLVGIGVFFLTDPVQYPPYYMELMENLMNPLDEVCKNLGISEADLLGDGKGNYTTPLRVEYAGVTFRLHLHTDIGSEDENLAFFSYTTIFDGSSDEGEKAAAAVARRLYRTYGPGELAGLSAKPDQFKKISAEEVSNALDNSATSAGQLFDMWDISGSGHGNLDDYLEALQTAYYQGSGTGSVRACYMAKFLTAYDRNRDIKTISITYRNYMNFVEWEDGERVTHTTKLN